QRPVALVYAADLAGASLGCVAAVAALQVVDAPSAVCLVASLGAVGALIFGVAARQPRVVVCSVVLGLAAAGVALSRPDWIQPRWVKGARREAGPPLYERWNSYSRIRISGDPATPSPPFGWGLSDRYPRDRALPQLLLSIDAIADTVLTRFDGNLEALDHLRHDATNVAHYLRRRARVLVVGAGGGRDVLSALAFGQREVLAVEVNGAILDAVNGRFGDFTGHLDRRPGVTFVNDEARSYVARLHRQ